MTRSTFRKNDGFTIVELLVTAALVGILLTMTVRALAGMLSDGQKVRESSTAAARNIFFLEMIARDARVRNRITISEIRKAAFADADGGETITWSIEGRTAWREESGARTSIPIVSDDATFSWKYAAPKGKYFCLRGEFKGLGNIEQGIGLRLEP